MTKKGMTKKNAAKKGILIAAAAVIICTVLCGCEYKELEQVTIVGGTALEGEQGNITMYTELLYTQKGSDLSLRSDVIESSGATLLEAMKNAEIAAGSRLYWSHTQIMIIGEKLAKSGISELLSQVRENGNLRVDISLVIAKGVSCAEIFSLKAYNDEINSLSMEKMLNEIIGNGTIPQYKLYRFNRLKNQQGQAGILPCITEQRNGAEYICAVDGCAIFRNDKLAGYLDRQQTFTLMMGRGEAKNGIFLCKVGDGNAELKIRKNSSKIKVYMKDGIPYADIETEFDMRISENNDGRSLLDKKYVENVKAEASEQIKNNIAEVSDRLARQIGADALGIGKQLYISDKRQWQSVHESWQQSFLPNIRTNIKVKVNIKGSNTVFEG